MSERDRTPATWEPLDPADEERLRRLYELPDDQERDYRPIHPEPTWRVLMRRLWAPIAGLGLLLWKLKFALAAVFKLKVFTTAGSMIVSVGAYALLGGWWFGLGLVLLIFVHEIGHVLELRRQGVPASAPLFIPFLGAFVGLKQLPADAWREAQVALAGPLLGSLGAFAVWGAAEVYDSNFLRAMAFVGFLINLFNLLPVVPLDGGRAVAALHPAIWLAGLAALAVLAFTRPNPILLLILLLGGMEALNRWRGRNEPGSTEYYRVTRAQRVAVAVVYLGLAAVLALAMHATHVPRDF